MIERVLFLSLNLYTHIQCTRTLFVYLRIPPRYRTLVLCCAPKVQNIVSFFDFLSILSKFECTKYVFMLRTQGTEHSFCLLVPLMALWRHYQKLSLFRGTLYKTKDRSLWTGAIDGTTMAPPPCFHGLFGPDKTVSINRISTTTQIYYPYKTV